MFTLNKLKQQQHFTLTEKRIADYLVQNIDQIPAIYIEELAKQTETSHSAIIRLSKKLGYSGFRELKLAISSYVHSQLHISAAVDPNFPFNENDSAMTIAKRMADLTIDTVKKTLSQLDEVLLNKVTELIDSADRILLFAHGDSQIRGRSFQNKLIKLNKFLIIAEEYADEYWNAANLTNKDCAIFLSYSGTIPKYERIMQHFNNQQVPSILVTGNQNSSLVKQAEITILAIQEEYDFAKIGTFSSQVAFEFILDTLFSILYAKEYRQNLLNLKAKQQLLQTGLLADPSE